ncbi:MAG: CBS domain-containing protein [Actinomycetota bacterium]
MSGLSDVIRELTDFDRPTAAPGDGMTEVAQLLMAADYDAVLVHRRSGSVAVLTERDIVRGVASGEIDTWVTDIMSRELVTVDADESVSVATRRMLDHGIRHLVVQDGDRLGILSLRDCVGPLVAAIDAS